MKKIRRVKFEVAHGGDVVRVLVSANWHKGRSCEILGISRLRLRRLINQFGLMQEGNSVVDRDSIENGGEKN